MAIVVEDGSAEFTPCRLAETVSDKSLTRPYRTSLYGESSTNLLYDLDPEIELTLRRLRKARNIVVSNCSNSVSSSVTNNSDSIEYSRTNSFVE
ncbi:hypothetical protein CR513_05539, partial [Mucuna pruriens]